MTLARTCRRLLLPLALAASVAGCGQSAVEDGTSRDGVTVGGAEGRFGLVVLTFSENRDNWRVRDQLNGSAWFVEHTEMPQREVLRLLNVPLVSERAPAHLDTCELRVRAIGHDAPASGLDGGSVYFMDAGEVTVDVGHEGLALDSAWFPDVYPEVAGLVYEGSVQNGLAFMSGPDLRVVGHGSGEVGPFNVEVAPPEPVRLASVAGREVVGHRVALRHAPERTEGGVDVTWSAPHRAGNGLLVVELVRRGYDRTATLACTVADDGQFTLPEALVARLPDYGRDQTDRLTVTRFGTAPFAADGLPEGQVLVLTRDSVLVD